MLMCWGKGVVVWGREGGGGETAWPWPSGVYPPSAVTSPLAHSDSSRAAASKPPPSVELLPPIARPPRSVSTMGRPPGSRSAAACLALGDNVLLAPRKRNRAPACLLLLHLASLRTALPAAAAAAIPPAIPASPCILPSHPLLSAPCSDAALLVLSPRAPRSSPASRPAPTLPALGLPVAGLCAGASVGSLLPRPPCLPGGLLYLSAPLSCLLARPTPPCTLAAPILLPPTLPPRHAPRSCLAPSSRPLSESPASFAPSPALAAAPTAETPPESPSSRATPSSRART